MYCVAEDAFIILARLHRGGQDRGRSDAEGIGHNSMRFRVAATQSIADADTFVVLPDVVLGRTDYLPVRIDSDN